MPEERILRAFAPPPVPAADEAADDPAEEAYARGVGEGREQAHRELEATREALRRELAESLRRVAELERRILAECESKMIELALAAASRIVRERVDEGDPVVARAASAARDAAPSGRPLTVRLHPDDADAVRESLACEIADGRLTLSEDADVTRGGCFVDSSIGTVDASIETATASIAEEVRG